VKHSTDTLSFEAPDGWTTSSQGSRLVLNGLAGEVAIISSWVVAPSAQTDLTKLNDMLAELERNAERSAIKAAAHPELTISRILGPDTPAGGIFPCSTLISDDGEVFFAEAVVRGPSSVLLLTFEVPLSDNSAQRFAAFLQTFGPALPRT
jgi:hypothetical protein